MTRPRFAALAIIACLLSTLIARHEAVARTVYHHGPVATVPTYFMPMGASTVRHWGYIGQGRGFSVGFDHRAITLTGLAESREETDTMTLALPGGPWHTIRPERRLAFTTNFLLGRDPRTWQTHVPAYQSVIIAGPKRGVNLRVTGTATGIRYDWVTAAPVRTLPHIAITVSRVAGRRFERVHSLGKASRAPMSHFSIDGHVITFRPPSRPSSTSHGRLLSDPQLSYATVFPPALNDPARIALNSSGEILAAGNATPAVAPLTGTHTAVGSPCPENTDDLGCSTVYVARLSSTGSLDSVTYVGGTGGDDANGLALDSAGNVYVVGRTLSSDFPTLSGLPATSASDSDFQGFVLALNPTADHLLFSTLIGGSDDDEMNAVAVTSSGVIDVVGDTRSNDFPVRNAFQSSRSGGDCSHTSAGGVDTTAPCEDAVVVQLAPMGRGINFSTFFGGTDDDTAQAVATDQAGNIYLTGAADSQDLPLARPVVSTMDREQSGFIVEFSASGSLVYSTYLGGFTEEVGNAITVDGSGAAYVAGVTDSDSFPVTQHAFQTTSGGGSDGFVVKVAPGGGSFDYSTYVGGSDEDEANGITVDSTGAAYVVGDTQSDDFPQFPAQETATVRDVDAFVTRLSPDGSQVTWSQTIGGADVDAFNDVVLAPNGQVVVGGLTASSDFPEATIPPSDPDDETPGYGVIAAITGLTPATPTPVPPTLTPVPPTAKPAPTKTKAPARKITCKKGYKLSYGKCVKKKKKKKG